MAINLTSLLNNLFTDGKNGVIALLFICVAALSLFILRMMKVAAERDKQVLRLHELSYKFVEKSKDTTDAYIKENTESLSLLRLTVAELRGFLQASHK